MQQLALVAREARHAIAVVRVLEVRAEALVHAGVRRALVDVILAVVPDEPSPALAILLESPPDHGQNP